MISVRMTPEEVANLDWLCQVFGAGWWEPSRSTAIRGLVSDAVAEMKKSMAKKK